MKRHALFRIAMLFTVLSTAIAFGSVPRLINYQGILTDAAGVVLEGAHDLTFSIYADSAATTAAWTETHTAVPLSKGVFNVILGGMAPMTDELFAQPHRWLGIKVDAGPETVPRNRLSSVPWALRSAVADSARVSGSSGGGGSLWQSSGDTVFTLSERVGIGTSQPLDELHIKTGSTAWATLLLQRGDNPDGAWTYLSDSREVGYLRKRMDAGSPYFCFDALANDGTSNSTFRFFRYTDTTGEKKLQLFRGDNTATIDAQIGVDGQNSYFQPDGGYFGIGTRTPTARLHVAGSGGSWGSPRLLIENTGTGDQVALGFRQDNVYDWEFGGINSDGRLRIRDVQSGVDKITIWKGAGGAVLLNSNVEANGNVEASGEVYARGFRVETARGYIDIGPMCVGEEGPCCPSGVDCGAIINCPASNWFPSLMIHDTVNNTYAGFRGTELCAAVKHFRMPNPANDAEEIWYASVEGPEAGAYCRGTATLVDGKAIVSLPEHFQYVAAEQGVTVQVTPLSADSHGLAVVAKSPRSITVQELQNGSGTYEFDYLVTAVRIGYEDYEVIRPKEAQGR